MVKATLIPRLDEETVYVEAVNAPGAKTRHERKLEDVIGALNDAAQDAYISVYKQLGNGRESMSLVGKWSVDHFDSVEDLLIFLRDNYGGASYRIHVRENGKLVCNSLSHVEKAPNFTPQKSDENSGAINAILTRMEKQDEILAALYREKSQPAPAPSKKDWLEEMLIYKQLFSGPAHSGGLGQIKEALDLVQSLGINVGGEREEKETSIVDVLDRAVPLLTAAISQPKPHQNPAQSGGDMNLAIKMGVSAAIRAAEKGMDAGTFAENADVQLGEHVNKIVGDPDIVQKMVSLDARCEAHRDWLADVIEHLKAINGLPSKFAALYDVTDVQTVIDP